MRAYLLCFVAIILLAGVVEAKKKDVCILGAGIAGMSAAVTLKDMGYEPFIIEKDETVGGHCDTVYFDPPSPGQPDWIDVGVISMFNTTILNALGLGPWIDIPAWYGRFVGDFIPVPVDAAIPTYNGDFKKGTVFVPPLPDFNAFGAALFRHLSFVSQFPWLNTLETRPDPIPASMLMTLAEYITQNQLEPLIPLFHYFLAGGTTNYSAVSAFDAFRLGGCASSLTTVIDASSTFSMIGGCYKLHEGIADYIGWQNILTNAIVTNVIRPSHGVNAPVVIQGRRGGSHRIPFTYTCDSLIVAFAPSPDKSGALNLNSLEASVLNKVTHLNYYVTAVDVAGPIATNSDFVLSNVDSDNTYDPAAVVAPAPVVFFRGLDYGPAVLAMTSEELLTSEQVYQACKPQLDNINKTLLSEVNVTREIYNHAFCPLFPAQYLGTAPNAFTQLDDLQGYRKTYWYTALNTAVSHAHVINHVANFLAAYFPDKSGNARRDVPTPDVPPAQYNVSSHVEYLMEKIQANPHRWW